MCLTTEPDTRVDMVKVSIDSDAKTDVKEPDSLGALIQRITAERGPFTSLTEKELENSDPQGVSKQEPLESETTASKSPENKEYETEEDDEEEQDIINLLDSVRADMVERIGVAINEAALSLDFVSLLISGVRPQAVASSLSLIIKDNVQLGSLSSDHCTPPMDSEASIPKKSPSAGWKILALEEVSQRLDNAHKRLKDEVVQEKRFWREVIDTVAAGEIIVGARNKDKRFFDIKYGYGESGSDFLEKGVGKIVRSSGGKMRFIPQSRPSSLVVRFTIFDKRADEQLPLAESKIFPFSVDNPAEGKSPLLRAVSSARYYLFEDELFLCLIEEARRLAGHKIQILGNRIVCQIHDEIIEIDQISASPKAAAASEREIKQVGDTAAYQMLADTMNEVAHLLLTYKHKQASDALHIAPPPMVSSELLMAPASKPKSPQLPILQSILSWRHHSTAVNRIVRLLEVICPGTSVQTRSCNGPPVFASNSRLLGGDSAIEKLMEEPRTVINFCVNDHPHEVEVQTPLTSSTNLYFVSSLARRTSFYELTEVEQWIRFVCSSD